MAAQWQKLQLLIQEHPGRTGRELARALHGQNAEQPRINQDLRSLVSANVIERRGIGGVNDPFRYYPIAAVSHPELLKSATHTQEISTSSPVQAIAVTKCATDDWFWEGNVVDSIARFLEHSGWKIEATANTLSKERGIDIHATKGRHTLLVEAKGYPSVGYRDPLRSKERKPTNPTNQAQHWYSHALLKVMRLQSKHPDAIVAIGLPDFPRYRTLIGETEQALKKLGVGLLSVRDGGEVYVSNIPGLNSPQSLP